MTSCAPPYTPGSRRTISGMLLSDDQVHNCRARIEDEHWALAGTYSDRAISGGTYCALAIRRCLNTRGGEGFDIIVAEALDRLSRDQEDIAALFKLLCFLGIKLVTLAEGEITELHVGLKGTMNALFLKDLAQKLAAVSPDAYAMASPVAAEAYGYEVALGYDAAGEVSTGELAIDPGQATVIRRRYTMTMSAADRRAPLPSLSTKKDVVGPSGKGWTASTIIGNRKRGTGILNNQLYVGRRIWNRLTYRRDPATRKRISQPNPPDDWIINEVPELRIIEDDLWALAQALQEQRSREIRADIKRDPDWRLRRPKHLFSGLIKCAACGGGMTLLSRVYYGCATNRNKGTCDNRLTLRLDRLEEAVLGGLQERLLTPELTKSFVQEYTREFNRLQAEASAKRVAKGQRLAVVDRQIVNIVETIAAGEASPALLQRLGELEREKADLEANRTETEPDPIRLHPNVDRYYVHKVAELRAALNQDASRYEAAEILRTLVDEIRLHPIDGELQIELIGDLATLLGFAKEYDPDKKSPGPPWRSGSYEMVGCGSTQPPLPNFSGNKKIHRICLMHCLVYGRENLRPRIKQYQCVGTSVGFELSLRSAVQQCPISPQCGLHRQLGEPKPFPGKRHWIIW